MSFEFCQKVFWIKMLIISFNHTQKRLSSGFTLMEILIAIAILGIAAAIAIPNFISYREKSRISEAISEMKNIEKAIIDYMLENDQELPDRLEDINCDQITDPWGRPYQYLRLAGNTDKGIKGTRRRDKNANPVNSDFDLYSMGPDGETAAQFTAKKGRDDIVRANDGAYYGVAGDH
jgi:general secretion pathway protein G